jgi:tRNA modification GTPase
MLTPRGRGAIASLSVAGPHALADVQRLFSPLSGPPLTERPLNRPVLGHWHPADRCDTNDELLVVCRTSTETLEVHSHGGVATQQFILDTLTGIGCEVVTSDHWLPHRALDRVTRDAYQALPHARTLNAAGILLEQYRGALSHDLRRAKVAVRDGQPHAAIAILERLLANARVGLHLTSPFQIAVVGRANVGKSSLVNAILGYQRSLVHQEAGTTRDVLTACTAVQGWPVRLADTAGYRITDDPLEGEGIARAARTAASADLVLLVADLSRAWTDEDGLCGEQNAAAPLIVHNKCDLLLTDPMDRPTGWPVSALTGQGLPELIQEIGRRLVPEVPLPGAAVPFRGEHCRAIASAIRALREADREQALQALEALLGPDGSETEWVPQES